MEKLIQSLQAVHAETSALAWPALGLVLAICILMGLVALFWIRRGGLAARGTQEFLAEQREIARWLKDAGL